MQIEPKCELCGKKAATSFSFFGPPFFDSGIRGWWIVCECAADFEGYCIPISQYFQQARQQYTKLHHMREKNWFNESDFLEMLKRCDTTEQEAVKQTAKPAREVIDGAIAELRRSIQ